MFSVIDLTGRGDLTGKAVWTNKGIGRTICTPNVLGFPWLFCKK